MVLDEILKRYPKGRCVCFSTAPPDDGAPEESAPASLRGVPCRVGPLVPRLRWRGARFCMPIVRAIGLHGLALWRVRQAVSFGRRHGVELVWAEFQGDALVLARKVAQGLGVPLAGTVWDDPEGWLADGGYDPFCRRFLRRRFREALRHARSVSTAGEAMQRTYEKEHGIQSVILRHGFDAPAAAQSRRGGDGIVIGFVGSAYGRDAWTAFLSAAARLNASGKLPQIKMRTFGAGVLPYRREGVEIESKGWRPAAEMLRGIAETDFCYLPYWFESKKRRHVELSFPNKFETYLAAGRPVLFHGPEHAGVAETIRKYGVGRCVHSLKEDRIAAVLEELIGDEAQRESFSRAAADAFRSEFNAGGKTRDTIFFSAHVLLRFIHNLRWPAATTGA